MRRNRANVKTWIVAALLTISATAGSAALCADAAAIEEEKSMESPEVSIHLRRTRMGACIADDFSRNKLDEEIWGLWLNDPGVEVRAEDGEVRISGTTSPEKPAQYNHVVLASKVFEPADQVLVARIRAASGIDETQGSQIFQVHLCGCMPDYHSSVSFARVGGKTGWVRMWRKWDPRLGDGGFLPPFGDEAEAFHQVKVEYNRGKVRGFVEGPEGWVELGEASGNFHGHARAELKVIMSPREFPVDMRVDDVRLYLHPEVYPAAFVVNNDYQHRAPWFVAARNEGLKLEVMESGSGKRVGEAEFDPERGVFEVMLDRDMAYPIRATVKVSRSDETVAEASIDPRGLRGLYPGDVWEIIEGPEVPRQEAGAGRRAEAR